MPEKDLKPAFNKGQSIKQEPEKGLKPAFNKGESIKQEVDKSSRQQTSITIFKEDTNEQKKITISDKIKDVVKKLNTEKYAVDQDNELDGFLIYDYFNSRNLLLFRPRTLSDPVSKIIIKRFDVINKEKMLGSDQVIKTFETTKTLSRQQVIDNEKILYNFGVDILQEDYNISPLTNFSTSLTDENGTKLYKYDDYDSKWKIVVKKYKDSINHYNKNIIFSFPAGEGIYENLSYRRSMIYNLLSKPESYNKIFTTQEFSLKKNDDGLFVGGDFYEKQDKIFGGKAMGDYIQDFHGTFGINLNEIYNETCNSTESDLYYLAIQLINIRFNILKIEENIEMFINLGKPDDLRFYVTLPELITNFLGVAVFTDYDNVAADIEDFNNLINALIATSSVKEIFKGMKSKNMKEYLADKTNQKIFNELINTIREKLPKTEEEIGKLISFLKRKATYNFMNKLYYRFLSSYIEKINFKKKYGINFLDLLFKETISDQTSYEEYKILNTFKHTAEGNSLSFKDKYDKWSFNPEIFMQITESTKEKMGLFIDDNIERNKVYQYHISQPNDSWSEEE